MQFHTRNPLLTRIAASVLVSILLSSCVASTGIKPYPAGWAPIRHGQAGTACPKIDGVYHDKGAFEQSASGRPCDYKTGECTSLIFGLLGDAHSRLFSGAFKGQSTVAQVQIEQPSPGVVEIIAKPEGKRQTLSMTNGDFTCNENGLRLAGKTAVNILLMTNLVSNESRTFNIADDGSLIMKSQWHTWGNHIVLLPVSVRNEEWVRWARVSQTQ